MNIKQHIGNIIGKITIALSLCSFVLIVGALMIPHRPEPWQYTYLDFAPLIALTGALLAIILGIPAIYLIPRDTNKNKNCSLRYIVKLTTGLAVFQIFLSLVIAMISATRPGPPNEARIYVTTISMNDSFSKLHSFKQDTGRFPTEKEGLEALITNPGIPGWNGPYLKSDGSLYDSWGEFFAYTLSNGYPNIISSGPDVKFGTKDDISTEFNILD